MIALSLSSDRLRGQRGQAIPFWVFGSIMMLALVFFILNYANTLRWQVRAQNAADSSAIAKISGDAAILNSSTLLLYALNLQNIKSENLLQQTITLLGGQSQCGTLALGGNCGVASIGTVLSHTVQNANDLQTIITQLPAAESQLIALANSPTSTANALAGQGCTKLLTDCAFTYTTKVGVTSLVPPSTTIDEVTCRQVPQVAAGFLHVGPTFYAIGRSTIGLAPLNNVIAPLSGSAVGPPDETLAPLFAGVSELQLAANANLFSVNLGVLVPQKLPATPLNNLTAIESGCMQG